jgi:signal transduction histidine kinase
MSYIQTHHPDMPIDFESNVPDDFEIETSRLYLMRSLREILYNAAKYSDKQNVKIRVHRTETSVQFIIQDTGVGIKAADREVIFQFFMKVDDLSEGLGLGLPLSKRHAHNLGGDLWIDTDYKEGCRIILELPLTSM